MVGWLVDGWVVGLKRVMGGGGDRRVFEVDAALVSCLPLPMANKTSTAPCN